VDQSIFTPVFHCDILDLRVSTENMDCHILLTFFTGMTLSIVEKNSHIQGASPLLLNMHGTIHVMLGTADGNIRGAEWNIWHKESLPLLSRALDPYASEEEWKLGVPIHAQTRFVSSDLSEVAAEFGQLCHWKNIQKPGEALFIPPGCCSQVSRGCIQIRFSLNFTLFVNF